MDGGVKDDSGGGEDEEDKSRAKNQVIEIEVTAKMIRET